MIQSLSFLAVSLSIRLRSARLTVRYQVPQNVPARIRILAVAIAAHLVPIDAAHRTQATTTGPALRVFRKRQNELLSERVQQVDTSGMLIEPEYTSGRFRRPHRRIESIIEFDPHFPGQLPEAAPALEPELDIQTAVHTDPITAPHLGLVRQSRIALQPQIRDVPDLRIGRDVTRPRKRARAQCIQGRSGLLESLYS